MWSGPPLLCICLLACVCVCSKKLLMPLSLCMYSTESVLWPPGDKQGHSGWDKSTATWLNVKSELISKSRTPCSQKLNKTVAYFVWYVCLFYAELVRLKFSRPLIPNLFFPSSEFNVVVELWKNTGQLANGCNLKNALVIFHPTPLNCLHFLEAHKLALIVP